METWEQILLGGFAILLIFLFRTGIKAALERSCEAEKDSKGALIPIGLVVLLIAMARST